MASLTQTIAAPAGLRVGPHAEIRILVADEFEIVRRGIRSVLELEKLRPWSVCAEAETGREAVQRTIELRPDVVIADSDLPELNGIETAQQIHSALPKTAVLSLVETESEALIDALLEAGVQGILEKSASAHDLVLAVEAMSRGRSFFNLRTSCLLREGYELGRQRLKDAHILPATSIREHLTPREREILQLVAEGKTSKAAAAACFISLKTVETHRASIMRKLDAHSVSDLVRFAVRNRMVPA